MFHDRNYRDAEDALESLKEEAREEGYQQGYLDALNDIELQSSSEAFIGALSSITMRLRKMVTSR